MLYYALEYDMDDEKNEASILWETESTSITETMKLVVQKPGFEYEIVSEQDIKEDIEKLYDKGSLVTTLDKNLT